MEYFLFASGLRGIGVLLAGGWKRAVTELGYLSLQLKREWEGAASSERT